YEQREKIKKSIGDEIDKLRSEFHPLIRDIKRINGKPHPEWVYTPSE
ncbi:MAG: hypothetical protein IIC76_16115, partial [Bacteroidetes bacterium]|nr:hypothetical protein [Bacteroidota bacterium]